MLKRPWGVQETPYPKKRMRLPVILSRDEVARLIESAGADPGGGDTGAGTPGRAC
jgi:hypothetical protein